MRIATIAEARLDFDEFCDDACRGETVIITSAGREDVALISASELAALRETAHLLRSPANALRLFTALERIRARSVASE